MQNDKNWSLKTDKENIVWLALNRADSKVNSLNESVLTEFDEILKTLKQSKTAKAVIIYSGKSTGFIVGADISQFKSLTSAEQATNLIKKGQEVFLLVQLRMLRPASQCSSLNPWQFRLRSHRQGHKDSQNTALLLLQKIQS